MDEYKQSYYTLFTAISDVLEMLEHQNYGLAKDRLIKAQQDAEEQFIQTDEQ